MRNKFSTFLLALLMTVSSTFYFVGCDGNNNNSNEGSDSGNPPAEHTHTYDTEWENDEDYHWHKATCEHTSEVSDKGEHVWDAGVETKEATYDSEGEMLFTCTVCGKTYTEVIGIKDFSIDPNEVEVSDIHRLHTDGMLAYLQGDKEDVFNYADGSEERSIPKAVSLTWDAVQGATQYSITIAENRDLTNGLTYASSMTSIDIYNCKARTTYFYQVSANVNGTIEKGEVSYFMTDATLPRIIKCDGVTNMRDLGGYVAGDKVVKQGMIYRSGRLNKSDSETLVPEITAEGINTMLNELKIKTEIDVRRPLSVSNEVGSLNGKSVLGDSVNYYHCGMEWSDGADNPSNYESLRQVFGYFADKDNYPIVFHCNIGTDRTGYISYLLGGLLGVEKEALLRDYLISNFGNIGGMRSLSRISSYVDAIDNSTGANFAEKTENYLVNVVGVSRSDIESIREIMLEEYSFTSKTIKEPTATEDGFKYYECLQDSSKSYFELLSKTEDNGVFVSVGNGVTVTDLNGNAIGNTVAVGTKVKVNIAHNDKTKIAKLFVNGIATQYFVVNGEQSLEYTIDENSLFNLHLENYHIHFDALSTNQTIKDAINGKEQGIDDNGYLAGPNYDEYSATQVVTLNRDSVFTTTLELNRGYMFGVRIRIGEEQEYRILARPWFRINGVGDYREEYVSIWKGATSTNYLLANDIVNDEVEIKLIFDSTNQKVYVFVNGEDFTERLGVDYTSTEAPRVHFYYCCERDQEAGVYKTWSVLTGADAVKAASVVELSYSDETVVVTENSNVVESGAQVGANKEITVSYTNASTTKVATIFVNGKELFSVAPNSTKSATFTTIAATNYKITVELNEMSIIVGEGITVTDENGDAIGSVAVPGTKVIVTFSCEDKTKIAKLYINGEDTGSWVVNGESVTEYTLQRATTFELVKVDYPTTFTADSTAFAGEINAREQGINSDGYLVGPNFNEYSSTERITLQANTVFETTVKMNNAYSFGIVFDIGNSVWLRIQARPTFQREFHPDYITITNYAGQDVTQNVQLSQAPANDEVTFKVVFDSEHGKIYLFVNGENYSSYITVPYAGTDVVRARFNYLCEKDTATPGYYKDWSIVSGADVVAEALKDIPAQPTEGYVNSSDLTGTDVTDGNVSYKESAKMDEIALSERVAGDETIVATITLEIQVPTDNIAGLKIKDDKGNFITIRIFNDEYRIFKPDTTVSFRGSTFANKGITADGTYTLTITITKGRVMYFYVDGVLFSGQHMGSDGGETNLEFANDATKLEISYIWTDDNTTFKK